MEIFAHLISKRIKNVIGKGSLILLLLLCCVVASAQQVEVTLTIAGTLSEKIATDQKYAITSLKVSGPINGTDVRYLREMAGWDYKGYSTSGKLAELDLTDANIVEGGNVYYDGYYGVYNTKNNVLGDYIFTNCKLTSIKLPNSVTSIGDYAFSNCSSLYSITVPSSVISIGSSAFSNNLKKVIMLPNSAPPGLSSVFGRTWQGMFYVANNNYNNISRLGTVKVYPHLSSLFEVDGVVYVPVNPSQRTCDVIDCNYNDTIGDIVIPQTVSYKGVAMRPQNVNKYSFVNSTKKGKLNLSNNGTVGEYAFEYCENLTSAVLSNKGSVGYCALSGCKNLTSAVLSNNGTVGAYALSGCKNLTSAVLSNNGTVGAYALSGCSSLESVVVGDGVTSLGNYCFEDCKSLSKLTISDNVTEIGNDAFSNSGLKTFSCPSELTSLGYSAFSNCKSLTEVKINGKLTALSKWLFEGCSSLSGLSIPANVKSVGNYAFMGCTSFATLVIENDTDVLALGSNYSSPLFEDCPLDSVYVGTHISYATSSSYGYSPFYRNATLRTVNIGDNVREVYDNEFYGCTGLKTAIVGENVAKIGNYAFSGCSSMESFLFGKNVESIGHEAFSDCTALTTLVTHRTTPPTCGTEALDDINKWNCTLYVPTNSLAAYQAADQWKEFFFIEEGAPTGIRQPISGTESTVIRRYDASGFRISSPTKGLNILKMSDGTTKKVLVK